jgi:hypothetical protein
MLKRRVTCLAVLAAAGLAAAAHAQSAVGDDPYDGRHVAVTVLVNRERAVVESVAVRPGRAHAQLAGSSRLRVRLLDGRGDLLREFGFPSPLSVRVYTRPATIVENEGEESSASKAPDEPPHTVIEQDEAVATIVIPLLPELAAVAIGWSDSKESRDPKDPKDMNAEAVGLREAIKRDCSQDDHAVCRAWLEATHEGK